MLEYEYAYAYVCIYVIYVCIITKNHNKAMYMAINIAGQCPRYVFGNIMSTPNIVPSLPLSKTM